MESKTHKGQILIELLFMMILLVSVILYCSKELIPRTQNKMKEAKNFTKPSHKEVNLAK